MAQRPTRGTAPVQKQNPEEEPAPKPQEKPQGQGTIAVVKSKIREKDAPRQEEESLPGAKVTTSKIAPRAKKYKKGSMENVAKDEGAAIQKADVKSEIVELISEEEGEKPEAELKFDIETKLEENQTAMQESKSKKSVAKIIQSKKSLGPTEDEETEGVQPKKSEIKKGAESFVSTIPLLSTTASPTPESQEQRSEIQNLMKNIQSDLSESAPKKSFVKQPPAQKNERKNYLANLSPEPLDEYPTDEEESKDQDMSNKNQDQNS